jgi:hypothetical protein
MTNTKTLLAAAGLALLLSLTACDNGNHYREYDGGAPARQQMGGPAAPPYGTPAPVTVPRDGRPLQVPPALAPAIKPAQIPPGIAAPAAARASAGRR